MLTITEIRSALESGKMLIGTDLTDGNTVKAVLGMDITNTNGEAHIIINCLEQDGFKWSDTGSTYHADFEGCGWFDAPEYCIWIEVADAETLPAGLVLGGEIEECEDGTDYYSDYRYEQRGMGLPR